MSDRSRSSSSSNRRVPISYRPRDSRSCCATMRNRVMPLEHRNARAGKRGDERSKAFGLAHKRRSQQKCSGEAPTTRRRARFRETNIAAPYAPKVISIHVPILAAGAGAPLDYPDRRRVAAATAPGVTMARPRVVTGPGRAGRCAEAARVVRIQPAPACRAGATRRGRRSKRGRSVILLEKAPALGGSTAWSVGSISATNTPQQIAAGILESPADHLEDLYRFNAPLKLPENEALSRMLVENGRQARTKHHR